MNDDPRYPVGPFAAPAGSLSEAARAGLIAEVKAAPQAFRAALAGLTPPQLDTPYRPGGWTLRQVAHHVPDSHLNAYVRFRLALTEDKPTIKTYAEDRWAELPEARTAPVELSLDLLEALHRRFVLLLENMSAAEWSRQLTHPDHGLVGLEWMLAMYAWHGRHHTGHVTSLRRRQGWA
jgi:DinB superfamily